MADDLAPQVMPEALSNFIRERAAESEATAAGQPDGAAPTAPAPVDGSAVETAPAGDADTRSEEERALSSLRSVDDFNRLAGILRNGPAEQSIESHFQAKDLPVQEVAQPDEVAAALHNGKPIPDRVRIKGLEVEKQRAIAALLDPNTSVEAFVRSMQGTTAAPAPAAPAAPVAPAPTAIPNFPPAASTPAPTSLKPPSESAEALRAQTADLKQQRNEARKGMDWTVVDQIEAELDAINERLPQVERAGQQYEENFSAAVWDSFDRASAIYPDMLDENSALMKEMGRLDQDLKRTGDPLLDHPNKPQFLAPLAAQNLGIAPRRENAPAAATAPAAKPTPVTALMPRAAAPNSLPPSPAAGGTRTIAPSPDAEFDGIKRQLAAVNNPHDFEKLLAGLK